jgi:hypothetical protein
MSRAEIAHPGSPFPGLPGTTYSGRWASIVSSGSEKPEPSSTTSAADQPVQRHLIRQSDRFNVPIVGGTGVYAGTRGYVHVTTINRNNSADTIVITG